LSFTPEPQITNVTLRNWLAEYNNKLHMDQGVRIRITLKADGIFSAEGEYLDGDAYWTGVPPSPGGPGGGTLNKLERCGDGHQGGDFESWAFLIFPIGRPTPTPEPTPPLPEPTPLPLPTFRPTIHPTFRPPVFDVPVTGVLPLTSVEITRTGGHSITVVDSGGERPSIAVADAPSVIEMEVAEPLVGDDAVAFVDSLRLVDKNSGRVVSGAPEFLAGNRLRITLDEPLGTGEYVVVREGDPTGQPTFGFDVT
jgi:hypothetical protein